MLKVVGTEEEQLKLEQLKEEEGVNKVLRELSKATNRDDFENTVYGKLLISLGYDVYVDKLNEYLSIPLYKHRKKERDLLLLINQDMKAVAFTVLGTVISYAINNRTLSATSKAIIDRLKDLFLVNRLKEDNPKLHTYLGQKFRRASKFDKKRLIKKHIVDLYKLGDTAEDTSLMVRLGTTLINILEHSGANIVEVVKVLENTKTVYKVVFTEEGKQVMYNVDPKDLGLINTNKLPMIVPPKDWTNNYDGGFLRGKNFLFTTTSGDVRKFLKSSTYPKLYPIINKLQKTAWRVNTFVLDVVEDIFTNNMVDPKSPTLSPVLYGDLPTSEVYTWKDFIKEEDYETWHLFNRAREDITIRLNAMNSRRLELILSLSVAQKMKKYEKLYYPYIFDYRGRVYSNVNFLTPQGQHYVKAMLELGEGKYLDTNGVYWLKVHTANVYGLDKLSFNERVDWFDSNYDMIVRVGTSPMECKADWVWSDSPFEFIAACNAFKKHLSGEKVYLPIQLDATCSGIQMYSGLLRDQKGAESVNVVGNTRNDIYQIVADKVNKALEEGDYPKVVEYTDKEGKEHSVVTIAVANSMVGNITRSIVKRNVMTIPYSVTRKGMSNQLWDKIDEAELQGKPFWEGDKWIVNKLLTHLNHKIIYEVIDGAKKGQEYLVELSRTLDEPAQWYGPIYNFPIKQTALQLKEKRVQTIYGALMLRMEDPKLNKRRQSNSIAPNFVHNIDSTILLYIIDNIDQQIGVIHDCFLAHPNDGYKLQDLYREGFIEVMKADPLRLIQQQLDPEGVVDFPEYGTLDLREVKKSKYIIS